MGDVFAVCEACQAPRSEQAMICASCGYHFKTKPVPAFQSNRPPDAGRAHHTEPPTIHEAPRTVPTPPPDMTQRTPPPVPPVPAPTMRSRWFGSDEAPRTLHSPSSPPVHGEPPRPAPSFAPPRPARRAAAWPWLVGAAALLVAVGLAATALYVRSRARQVVSPEQRARAQISWEGTGGTATGQLDASPAEDFVGRYLKLEGRTPVTFVGVFSGDDMHELWRAGPFEAGQQIPFAVVGTHVLVGDPRTVLHVHDGATGKETHLIELSDRATRITTSPAGGHEAFIEVANGTHVLFDAAAGKAKVTARPSWAPAADISRLQCGLSPSSRTGCVVPWAGHAPPILAGFEPRHTLTNGDFGIALGRAATAPSLKLVAFSTPTRAVLWQAAVPTEPRYAPTDAEVLETEGDAVFVVWGAASNQQVAAFGAKDGARRWDTTLPAGNVGPARFVSASAARVYVSRSVHLDVLDRRSGAVLGGVGTL